MTCGFWLLMVWLGFFLLLQGRGDVWPCQWTSQLESSCHSHQQRYTLGKQAHSISSPGKQCSMAKVWKTRWKVRIPHSFHLYPGKIHHTSLLWGFINCLSEKQMTRKYNTAFSGWFVHLSLLIFLLAQKEKNNKEHMENEQEPFLNATATWKSV